MSPKSIIAAAITEIRGEMTDQEFAEALGAFTNGEFNPSPSTIQKYRTGRREPSYVDFHKILGFGRKTKSISPLTAQRLADFFQLLDLRRDFVELQLELFALQAQQNKNKEFEDKQYNIPETKINMEDIIDSPVKTKVNSIKRITFKEKEQKLLNSDIRPKKTKSSHLIAHIPILVQIPSGQPVNLEENCEGYVTMPRNMVSDSDYFFLKIFGESSQNPQINDGDLVLVRVTEHAEDGQSIIGRVKNQEICCKKYYRTSKGIILLPTEDSFEPLAQHELQIIGIVEKVTRNI